jgi:hypothetical protein
MPDRVWVATLNGHILDIFPTRELAMASVALSYGDDPIPTILRDNTYLVEWSNGLKVQMRPVVTTPRHLSASY